MINYFSLPNQNQHLVTSTVSYSTRKVVEFLDQTKTTPVRASFPNVYFDDDDDGRGLPSSSGQICICCCNENFRSSHHRAFNQPPRWTGLRFSVSLSARITFSSCFPKQSSFGGITHWNRRRLYSPAGRKTIAFSPGKRSAMGRKKKLSD